MLTEEEFEKKYDPLPNPRDGSMFWSLEDVNLSKTDTSKVWTLIEGDDDNIYASPGFRFVNRIGYSVTRLPWNSLEEDAVWLEKEDLSSIMEGPEMMPIEKEGWGMDLKIP